MVARRHHPQPLECVGRGRRPPVGKKPVVRDTSPRVGRFPQGRDAARPLPAKPAPPLPRTVEGPARRFWRFGGFGSGGYAQHTAPWILTASTSAQYTLNGVGRRRVEIESPGAVARSR